MNSDKYEFLAEVTKWFGEDFDPQIKKDLDNSHKKMLEKLPYEEALVCTLVTFSKCQKVDSFVFNLLKF